jgi:hypothetical protein
MHYKLNKKIINNIESEIILMLLNCIEYEEKYGNYMWNANNPYYAEAFGILRGLTAIGYTFFGASNTPENKENAQWWFGECKTQAKMIKNEIGIEEALILYKNKCNNNSKKTKENKHFCNKFNTNYV